MVKHTFGLTGRQVFLVASPVLARRLGPVKAGRVVTRAIGSFGRSLAEFRRTYQPEQMDTRGETLYGLVAAMLVLYREIERAASEEEAAELVSALLSLGSSSAARVLMPGIPKREREPFEWFKRRYERANGPLTLLDWHTVEESDTCFEAHFTRCEIAEITRRLGYPQVGPLFCAWDDRFFADYDPRVTFIRRHTIARGSDHCDFRFEFDNGDDRC